ncbi:ABC transporter ATP-binding protein [Reyranella sp. CPCC 100927]|uniref:ABC transporter ATP-binding protein n=1 Tax=Reyranella sp. CPCC 100927 TaxID=2599616 RepID=UPI0011B54D40|nr:ABC transporter ATP-binding protein [Reyranella sp. CPCC 100927]TWT02811.1 ABC transporter ATP-binding protein [Reyranella sp. CPCC 100927]
MSAIRLEDLGKTYGALRVIEGIDLVVADGEFFTILGPSGSGKTTLLTLIAGLTTPSGGRILFDDRDVTHVPAAGRDVGLVFQNYALFPHMTVFDNIAFPLSVRRTPRAELERRVAEALSIVRLTGLERRKPSQLSGGQQQRVALARAIVFRPAILLLDEPLGALDRKLREELQVELKELQRSLRITTILVTHDQEEALSLSDRILVIDKGAAQQIAPPQEAYLRPANRFVAEFLGIPNFIPTDGGREGIVRPERLEVAPSDQHRSGNPSRQGRVREAVYLGQTVRLHVTLDEGREVIAAVPSSQPAAALRAGDAATVSWKPQDVWPLTPAVPTAPHPGAVAAQPS